MWLENIAQLKTSQKYLLIPSMGTGRMGTALRIAANSSAIAHRIFVQVVAKITLIQSSIRRL